MSAGTEDRRRPTQTHTTRALTPGDDLFALSAVPMFCFINASFCNVPWTWLQQWQPLFTSAPPSEHRMKLPGRYPEGRCTHCFRGSWSGDILTASTHALWHKAGTLLQPTRCLFNSFFLQKRNLINQVSWYTSLHSMIHEARGLVYSPTQGSTFASWYKVLPSAQGSPCRMGTLFCCPKSTLLCGHWGKVLLN